ncbi:tandem large repeat [uncultured Photobacterium sp.]|uniref:tandem large repeat n=1 Tax=uncultured Photobacterium sp. TaxID=173973 RepID=UPI002634272E|nr:tandem large repeat [uncultured Photobacterium sp.]
MIYQNYNKSRLFYIFLAMFLTSCGGGGGGGGGKDSSPPKRKIGGISGTVFDAPISGATISAWEYRNGQLGRQLGQAKTSPSGYYSIELESASMPVLIQAKGGAYLDPLTNETVLSSNGKTLRLDSVINYSEGSQNTVMVTPLSYMVKGLAEYKIKKGHSAQSAIDDSISTISNMYGFDVNTTQPVDITKGGQSSEVTTGHQYGALLTAYSSYSSDLINQFGGDESKDIYTSIHLADIQYRDIRSDGLLDGREVDDYSGLEKNISFGQIRVTSDVYTHAFAQHVLIVANDPKLNFSGTTGSDYQVFSNKINRLGGGSGSGGAIPPRDITPIDTAAPEMVRLDSDVLAKRDQVDVRVSDALGVDAISVSLQYKNNGNWSDLVPCPQRPAADDVCSLDYKSFVSGERQGDVVVTIDTEYLDRQSVNISDPNLASSVTDARLVVNATDVIGNTYGAQDGYGVNIPFKWDNHAPVITIVSADTHNITLGLPYKLEFNIKEDSTKIAETTVSVNRGKAEPVDCTPISTDTGQHCYYAKEYGAEAFNGVNVVDFAIKTKDEYGNEAAKTSRVFSDAEPPVITESYPPVEVMMDFIAVRNGNEEHESKPYTASSFSNIKQNDLYLKVAYQYAKDGLLAHHSDVDFSNFDKSVLDENRIPYITVRLSDNEIPVGNEIISTKPEELTLNIQYQVIEDGQSTPFINQIISSDKTVIPHQKVEDGSNSIVYYIPYVREFLGSNFVNVGKGHTQTLTLTVKDKSGNRSAPISNINFRTTFDLPRVKVVSPYIGAKAEFYTIKQDGSYFNIGSCVTQRSDYEDGSGKLSFDVASCSKELPYTAELIRVALASDNNTHFYGWNEGESYRQQVILQDKKLSAIFVLDSSLNVFITELAVYQSGFFDYLWSNYEGEKSSKAAISVLNTVNKALVDNGGSGNLTTFFGFNPVLTRYATNEDLAKGLPAIPDTTYQHRFLLESVNLLSAKSQMQSSIDYAQAFYDDFRADGKADGLGENGQKLSLENYVLSADTYRKELADYYYQYTTIKQSMDVSLAMAWADRYALINPVLVSGDKILNVFDKPGISVDSDAPDIKLTPIEGRSVVDELNKTYVAGLIKSQLSIKDPSGIDDFASPPLMIASWSNADDVENEANDIKFLSDPMNVKNKYSKKYDFTLDTQSYPNIVEFILAVSTKDTKGNAHGYDGNQVHYETYAVDNNPPEVTFKPPFALFKPSLPEDSYLNTNSKQELNFSVRDLVGDDKALRKLVFSKAGENGALTVLPESFYLNDENRIKVNICKKEACEGEGSKFVDLADGQWKLVVEATDSLGNVLSALDPGTPKFIVNVDSVSPEVNQPSNPQVLGGNSIWDPRNIVIWGDGAAAKELNLSMTPSNGSNRVLVECETLNQPILEPACLLGKSPDYRVQLIADNLEHNKNNEIKLEALDAAYPSNVGKGSFYFRVDKKGPSFNFAVPALTDVETGSSKVLGKKFNVNFASVVDDSGVKHLQLYQALSNGSLIPLLNEEFEPSDSTKPFAVNLLSANTDKLKIDDGTGDIKLLVKATDINDFVSESNSLDAIFDKEGPSLSLSGYNKENYYKGNYKFQLNAVDYDKAGSMSSDGIDSSSLKYWVYPGDTPPQDNGYTPTDDGKVSLNNANSDVNVKIYAKDIRKNENSYIVPVKVRNEGPTVSLKLSYLSGSPVSDTTVTKNEPLLLTLVANDISGVSSVNANLTFAGTKKEIKLSQATESDTWTALLNTDGQLKDGAYIINAKAYNNVVVNDGEERVSGQATLPFNMQLRGVDLQVVEPENFTAHVSGSVLNVTFKKLSDTRLKKIECWLRESYSGDEVPEGDTYKVTTLTPSEPITCSFDGINKLDKNFVKNPALITRTTISNRTESIQAFNFKMIDIEPPYIDHVGGYKLNPENVATVEGVKKLTLQVNLKDDDSGINLAEKPKLVTYAGVQVEPVGQCEHAPGNTTSVTCTYSLDYSQVINPVDSNQFVRIVGITDMAGNSPTDSKMILVKPRVDLGTKITSPKMNGYIYGDNISIDFRVKHLQETSLSKVQIFVGGKEVEQAFDPFEDCVVWKEVNYGKGSVEESDKGYDCSRVRTRYDDTEDNKQVNIVVKVTDVWGVYKDDNISVRFDNQPPYIGDSVDVKASPENPGKVRFTFDISDSASGIDSVQYQIATPRFSETKRGDDSYNFIELDASELESVSILKVNVTAKDKVVAQLGYVGEVTDKEFQVNITKPELILELEGESELIGNKIAFKERKQDYTLIAKPAPSSVVGVSSYRMVFDHGDMDITQNGVFNANTAIGSQVFTEDQQGSYQFKLTATDTIGRKIDNFAYDKKIYGFGGAEAYVDYLAPKITGVMGKNISMKPEGNKYKYSVEALITDATLIPRTVTATMTRGDLIEIIPPKEKGKPYIFNFLALPGGDTVTIEASDEIGRKTPSSASVNVDEATVPALTISSTAKQNMLGGGKLTILTFAFSEDVQKFDFSDVTLTASDGGDSGSLNSSTWTKVSNHEWNVQYTSPLDLDKNITVSVEENSYESINTIPGTGNNLALSVKSVLPKLSRVEFAPSQSKVGKEVEIKLFFDKPVTGVSGDLGGESFTLSDSVAKTDWIVHKNVPSVSGDKVVLTVENYTDELENVGEPNSEHALPYTPTLAINVENGGVINKAQAQNNKLSGTSTHFSVGQPINLKFVQKGTEVSATASVSSENTWTMDSGTAMTSLANGPIKVIVSGTNQLGAIAESVTETFELDLTLPEVNHVDLGLEHVAPKTTLEFSVEFTKSVSDLVGYLGSSEVEWTTSGSSQLWQGKVKVPEDGSATTETVTLTLSGFRDEAGNEGDTDTSGTLKLTPSLEVMPVGAVSEEDAKSLPVSGQAKYFVVGSKLDVEFRDVADKQVTVKATVASGGKWELDRPADVAGLKDGDITVTVSGTNGLGVDVSGSDTFTLMIAKPEVDGDVILRAADGGEDEAPGQEVDVTVQFTKSVSDLEGYLGSSEVEWTTSGSSQLWQGKVKVPEDASATTETVTLTLSGFRDEAGNEGDTDTSGTLKLTPSLEVMPVGTVKEVDAKSLMVSGKAMYFAIGSQLEVVFRDEGTKTVEGQAMVASGGRWELDSPADVAWLKNGEITVTVSGENGQKVTASKSGIFELDKTSPIISKPSVNLDIVAGDDLIDSRESMSVLISGSSKGFAEGDTLKVTVQSQVELSQMFEQDVVVGSGGNWVITAEDLSSWQDSKLDVIVEGANQFGISADRALKTIELNQRIAYLNKSYSQNLALAA